MNQSTYGRDILTLATIFLVGSLAVEMLSPIWPVYINLLGASMTELGLVFSISTAVGAMMQIPSGLLSDRIGRKKLHLLGMLLAVFPPLMYALANNWVELIPWAGLSGLASGLFMPVRWAIVADVSSRKTMASSFSWTNIAWLVGSTVAPFLGGIIADAAGVRCPFIIGFVLRLAVLPFAFLLQETRKKQPGEATKDEGFDVKGLGGYLSTVVLVSLINVIQGVGMGVTAPVIPLFVMSEFHVDFTFIGVLYAIGFGAASIAVQIPGAKCSNVFDRRKVMFVTFVASSPFFLLFAYSRSPVELIVFMFLSNAILNLHWSSYQTFLMDATPSSKWGFINGVSATTFWIGVTFGNALSGILWDNWGALMPFYVSAVAVGFSALPLFFLKETRVKPT